MFLPFSVCLLAGKLEKLSANFDEIYSTVGCVISNRRVDFGGEFDHDVYSGMF